MSAQNPLARWERYFPLAFFLVGLLGMANIFGRYFPNMLGLLGHDFALANPALLDGAFWFWKNGWLAVPWFTPSFCGGQPFFADAQSVYYSPLQWFTFILPPTKAAFATMLLALAVGYWSFYGLARRVFALSLQASVLAGLLALLNGFIPYRFLLGEMGYQWFLLTGFVALALLDTGAWQPLPRWRIGNVFWAGLAIALMLHGGLTTLMIPAALGVLLLAIVASLLQKGVTMPVFLLRGFTACCFAVALCAAKLLAGAVFMSHFPREAYRLPGFVNLHDALLFPLYSMFLQSQTLWSMAMPRMTNLQWTVFPHEWAYQFGLCYLAVLLTGLFLLLRERSGVSAPVGRARWRVAVGVAVIILVLLLPSALLWYSPGWNAVLKTIPIINTTSFPFRWIIIWIPLACLAGALVWPAIEHRLARENAGWPMLGLLLVGMLLESTLAEKTYYYDPGIQRYDPAPVDRAWALGREGKIPAVSLLVDDGMTTEEGYGNASIINGQSFLHCYNPAYGYRQETLPVGMLQPGLPVLSDVGNGHLNIKNPACLIWPEENGCAVMGDEYRLAELENARRFVERAPVDFHVSPRQQLANRVTVAALLLTLAGLVLSALAVIRRVMAA